MSERQAARKIKSQGTPPHVISYADGLIALGQGLKDPECSIRELTRRAHAVGMRLEFSLAYPKTEPASGAEKHNNGESK